MTQSPQSSDKSTTSTFASFGTGTKGSGGRSEHHNSGDCSYSRAVWAGRIVFLLALVAVAATMGSVSYYLLTNSERTLTHHQFASIADRATRSAMEATERKRLGAQSLASVIGGANPDPSKWPYVTVTNFESIAMNIIHTSKGCNMAWGPLVQPSELAPFEDFIYDYYHRSRLPEPFSNDTAMKPGFGKGVWAKDSEGTLYHDVNGTSADSWNSTTHVLAPMVQHNTGPSGGLLMNMHSIRKLGKPMDDMMACAQDKAAAGRSLYECAVITPTVANRTSKVQKVEPGPGANMVYPIFAALDPTKLVGVVSTGIVWKEIMVGTYSDSVGGIDVVLKEGSKVFTYKVVGGRALGGFPGDTHDPQFDSYAHTLDMTSPEFFGPSSAHLTLTLYPTQELYDVYKTPNPIMAGIGAVCIIAFTSVLFLLYDLSVRREFNAKRELLEAKRRFCRFVSHEVRTPLNSVCMGLTLMTEEMTASLKKDDDTAEKKPNNKDEENCRSWLTMSDEITSNANSAVNVLNDFLNYDKVESGKLHLELTIVPVFDLIQKTAAEFKVPAAKSKINLVLETPLLSPNQDDDLESGPFDFASRECFLVGDKLRLTMVVRNLISNSLKFTPQGGTVTIRATWVPPTEKELKKASDLPMELESGEKFTCTKNGSLQLSVTDTGVGMTPEQIKAVFKQGSQFNVNQLQAGKGSGLGTWIAKGIIRQHGGLLSASSEGLNSGSTFIVNLPIHNIPSPLIEELVPVPRPNTSASFNDTTSDETEEFPIGSLKILVVDDAKMNLKLLTRLLVKHGHVVEGAMDGDVAVEMVQAAMQSDGPQFDVILMDYQMPRMTGPEAASKIREMGADAFIVGVTGNLMPEDVRFFKDAGANAVLPKPIKLPDLEDLWTEYGIRGEDSTELTESQRMQKCHMSMQFVLDK